MCENTYYTVILAPMVHIPFLGCRLNLCNNFHIAFNRFLVLITFHKYTIKTAYKYGRVCKIDWYLKPSNTLILGFAVVLEADWQLCHTEWSQSENHVRYVNAYGWNLKKWYRLYYLQNRKRDTDIVGEKVWIPRRDDGEGWDELGDWGWHIYITDTMYR